MSDILIKNMKMPSGEERLNLTILPDGSVIEHFPKGGGKWSSYKSCGAKAKEMPPHERLIGADQLQEVLNLTLSLVITNKLTDKEIELVHRAIGAISDAVNKMDTILEASNG